MLGQIQFAQNKKLSPNPMDFTHGELTLVNLLHVQFFMCQFTFTREVYNLCGQGIKQS